MALGHKDGRRPRRRAFQPTIDGRLESRLLLSATPAQITAQTAAGGQAVVVTNTVGQQFYVSVTQGTIQAFPASGGRVSLVANNTTSNTLLEINQLIPMHSDKEGAHTLNSALGGGTGILNIAAIQITSGQIYAIEGYHTASLSGPLTIAGSAPVNRIAFLSILPGASIATGGDLDTLDVFGNADFSGSYGLYVGQDLNWFETGGDLSFTNGANMVVVRAVGQTFQIAKGTGNGGQGLYVNGNMTIGAADFVSIGTYYVGPYGILINGNLSGATRFLLQNVPVTTMVPVTFITGLETSALNVHGAITP